MPIYEFICTSCRHEYEDLVSRVDQVAPCPECGSEKAERAISRPAPPQVTSTTAAPPCAESCPAATAGG